MILLPLYFNNPFLLESVDTIFKLDMRRFYYFPLEYFQNLKLFIFPFLSFLLSSLILIFYKISHFFKRNENGKTQKLKFFFIWFVNQNKFLLFWFINNIIPFVFKSVCYCCVFLVWEICESVFILFFFKYLFLISLFSFLDFPLVNLQTTIIVVTVSFSNLHKTKGETRYINWFV